MHSRVCSCVRNLPLKLEELFTSAHQKLGFTFTPIFDSGASLTMPGAQNVAKGQGPEQGQEQERDSEAARLSAGTVTSSASSTVTSHEHVACNLDGDGPTDGTLEADAALNQLVADITTAVRELNPAQRSVLLGGLRATL